MQAVKMIDLKLVHEHTKSLNVLYVEDNEQLRASTLQVFNNFFNEVHIAVDGLDGLDKYKTFLNISEKPYDLVISDINMPHFDGVEMSEKILELEPSQSIIFVTAHNEIEYLHKAIRLGVSSFLLKPLNLQDLAAVLYKVCQAITDRRLVSEHYAMIEDMNAQLENQNQLLQKQNQEQEKLIRLLETMDKKVQRSKEEEQLEEEMQTMQKEDSYYEQIEQLRQEDLPELMEIHEELDAHIIAIIGGKHALIEEIPALFSKYASILSMYSSFDSLTATMMSFTKAMQQYPLPRDESKTEEIFMFLEAFMYILGKWQKDLLDKDSHNVHQLDVSIIGDIETITNMWLAEAESEESCAVEFF